MRTGKTYLEQIANQPPEIWVDGERVKDPIRHPRLASNFKAMADYYDLQHRLKLNSESSVGKIGSSLLVPRSSDDVSIKGQTYYQIASHFGGFLGRSPDYLNSILSVWAGASDFFNRNGRNFGANVQTYYEHVAKNDLAITHSVVNPARTIGASRVLDSERALKVLKETDAGIIVQGVRHLATGAPVCDEVAVYGGRMPSLAADQADFALAFAVPLSTPGIRLIARDAFLPYDNSRDYRLSANLDEMDALLIFENVLIPWERVFIYRDPEAINTLHSVTGSVVHSAHQSVCKSIAKSEFIIGSLLNFVQAHDTQKMPQVHQRIGEALVSLECLKALRYRAEAQTQLNKFGLHIPLETSLESGRALYMKDYSQLIETARVLGSGNLMMVFSEQSLAGQSGDLLMKSLAVSSAQAKEKAQWNRVVWDLSSSSFGTRQELYERLYAGGVAPSFQFVSQAFPDAERERLQKQARSVLKNLGDPPAV